MMPVILRTSVFTLFCLFLPFTTGNSSCSKIIDDMINVHLICHTHDDVGWLKTVDQYYYGAKNEIQNAGVQYILDSVVDSLLQDSQRKFIYVESAFFFRWWDQQTAAKKKIVTSLVKRGQLEFIGGGWCMNDEAGTHYNAIIDQMTLGLTRLNETFGNAGRPRIAWQIDPFGHSREQASLFAQMGFDGLFFGRLDFDDKKKRMSTKTMEMVWLASENIGDAGSLFTGALPDGYGPPPGGFCFDVLCSDPPIMDDPKLHDFNVNERVEAFLNATHEQAKIYATNNLIMTMGEDFTYQNANTWYKNLDKLIRYVNALQSKGSKVNVFYSTPSCYIDALHAQNHSWPSKNDDFFPYASDHHAYWTGYFTSRPTLKGYVRQTNGLLQAAKQVSALLGIGRSPGLMKLIEAMGVAQHHDAVSGTAKQHVTDDYSERLSLGITESLNDITAAFSKIQTHSGSNEKVTYTYCPLLNISSCPVSENSSSFVITVYNPVARPRNHYIRVPVSHDAAYIISDGKGKVLRGQLVPLPEEVLNVPGRTSSARFDLVFYAADLPPLGYAQYHIQQKNLSVWHKLQKSTHLEIQDLKDSTVSNGMMGLKLNQETGHIEEIFGKTKEGEVHAQKFRQQWMWYQAMNGNNSKEDLRASGAYIFRPNGTTPTELRQVNKTVIFDGPVVTEIHQVFSPWVSVVARLYKQVYHIELEWLVGPIPIDDGIGKEVISRVTLGNVSTNGTFFTDSNGREILKRMKNFRPTWTLNVTEPVSGNYYPVNSRLILKSAHLMAAMLTDRSQGGTSLDDGQIELMVHRRLLHDDAFGVGESLNETAFGEGLVVRGKHFILTSDLTPPDCDFSCMHRTLGEQVLLPPVILFSPSSGDVAHWRESFCTSLSGLTEALPRNVHLLTLEPWGESKFLLRLENMYERAELNEVAYVNITNMFANWRVTDVLETTLAANQLKADSHRLQWDIQHDRRHNEVMLNLGESLRLGSTSNFVDDEFRISLQPMEIRTFIVTIKSKNNKCNQSKWN